jgi:hypothetical protein
VLVGITYPILKNALFQPTFRSVLWFLSIPSLCSVNGTATTIWSAKAQMVGEWKAQPDEPDNDEIHVLQIIGNPKPVLPFHHGLDIVGVSFPERSELLARKYAFFTIRLRGQFTAAGNWLLCLQLKR